MIFWALFFALIVLLSTVGGYPYFLVQSGKPYCVELDDAIEKTKLLIHYDAPDIDTNDSNNRAPVYLFIQHHTDAPIKRKPFNADLKDTKGIIEYEIVKSGGGGDEKQDDGGRLEVCIRASNAGSKNPMRFGLKIEDIDDTELEHPSSPAVDVDSHLTYFEEQLRHYEGKLRLVLKAQDSMKERDAQFHKRTDSMHQATTFWPILHCGIILITGFTQANHIVRFFQKRKII